MHPFLFIAGLAPLIAGAELLVRGASRLALSFGVSPLVVGLTVVAFGTSAPELAVAIGERLTGTDIAVGNVVGSNMFNLPGCLGVTGLIAASGLPIAQSLLNFDLWVMLATAFACLPICLSGRVVARFEGALFLGCYVAYATYLILAAQAHDALPAMSLVLAGFGLPIALVTLVTLVVVALRQPPPRSHR